MKFLSKTERSQILNENLTYQEGKSEHNRKIKELLLTEQCLEYFRNHHEELSFITAIENELGLDLSEFSAID